MDKTDAGKIFDLLEQFYPNAAAIKDKKKRYAWRLALEPYSFEDVRAAVLDYAAKGKYFPDLSDITANLDRREASTPDKAKRDGNAWMEKYIHDGPKKLNPITMYAAEHRCTWGEAKEAMRKAVSE